MLSGRPVGRGQQGFAPLYPNLCRGQSSSPDPCNWAPGVGTPAGLDCWAIPPIPLCHGSKSSCVVLVGQGGVDHPCGKGGGGEEGGGNEDGGGDEKGEESPMDGLIGWTRLGKEGRLPQDACVILQLCFLF